ncbi:MAG TPA: hypothetical protein PLM14_00155 [Candidatus Hydrogenedentes bacterium]|nr:hypothetical protein [Candidatus Hydrogenedentota bacterium]HQE81374.1 hypothetical protein [Candidatus Hydrogenedentota bacterium]HQH50929.1 hypothetical protein [Candidatus Hydrogenedentota bacterium]HQM47059.1 hypothetical protein [Candidatus Hydrogenedentota bacterium]
MSRVTHAKQERIVEAVRLGLEGDAAVEFVRESGFAMTSAGIARHLRSMGGRGHVQELIENDLSNIEILQHCFPQEDLGHLHEAPPSQPELFDADEHTPAVPPPDLMTPAGMFETRKIALRLPSDLYEAIRLAARAENTSKNQLIVDILSSALAQMPKLPPETDEQQTS